MHEPTLQHIYETAPIGLAFLSPDCRYLHINQRLTEICGISVEGHLGRTVRECVPGLAASIEEIVRTVTATGQPVAGVEVAGQRPGVGEARAWVTYWHPFRGPDGTIVGINVAAEEITERKRAQAALATSERQFHTLADAIPQLVWMADDKGAVFWFNHHWYDYTGVRNEGAALDWQLRLAPGSEDARRDWAKALADEQPLETEVALVGRDGQPRPFLTRIVPLRDSGTGACRWLGTHIDISEQKQREDHIRFVVDELSHRTKNLLAVVIAIANQTAQHAGDVRQYQMRLLERLQALAHCHDLLAKDSWHGASFCDLISAQMRPFHEASSGRIAAEGPPLLLRPEAVQYLGLALHELATNASKHGALSGPAGMVLIRWQRDAGGIVRLDWRETGGPAVSAPGRRGFGHVVIEKIVPRALHGQGTLAFAPEGVHWRFEFAHAGG